MARKIGRVLLIAIAVELLAILTLVLLVALLGPSEQAAAEAYAERIGYWVGPIAGFVFSVGGGWLVAKRQPTHHVRNGLILGLAVAAIDIAILLAMGADFQPIFALSDLGKIVAGSIGGWLASRGKTNAS